MITAIGINGTPDQGQRRCFDCLHCKAAVSWWCTNKEAIEFSGTKIPGFRECNFWDAMEISDLTERELNSKGYIVVDLSTKETSHTV